MSRLRLTTSRPAGYRRGGLAIGNVALPTFLASAGDVSPEGLLAILADPNVDLALEVTAEGGGVSFRRMDAAERIEIAEDIRVRLADDLETGLGGGNVELQLGDLAALDAEPKRPFAGLGAVIPGQPEQAVGEGIGKPDVDGVTSSQSVPAMPVTAPIDPTSATELQPASGVEGETGGGMPSSVKPTTSSEEANASVTSANSPGTGTSSTDAPGHSREKTHAPVGSEVAGAGEGKQPGETSQPPVVEPASNKGPSAAPAADKPAGRAKPKGATQTRA